MYCPLKFNSSTLNAYGNCYYLDACQCEKALCMAWDRISETCDLVTSSHRRSDREASETEGGIT